MLHADLSIILGTCCHLLLAVKILRTDHLLCMEVVDQCFHAAIICSETVFRGNVEAKKLFRKTNSEEERF